MLSKLPEVKIKYNRLLDPIFIFYCQNNPELRRLGWDKWVPPAKEVIEERVKNYCKAWESVGEIILTALSDVTGLEWKVNMIDVHVVSGNPRQISHPLIIKSGFSPKEFISFLTHEIIHHLFSLNRLPNSIYQKYDGEIESTNRHVLVHSLLKYIYLDVLNDPEMLNNDIEGSKLHRTNEYSRAWEIVERGDYQQIIARLKEKTEISL